MKKSIKILALILTLALVCGALVIGTFAAAGTVGYDYANRTTVTGESVLLYMDFENATVGLVGTAKDASNATMKTNNGKSANPNYVGRSGEAAIISAVKGEQNKLMKVTKTEESYVGGIPSAQVFNIQTLGNGAAAAEEAAENGVALGELSYFVVEYDIFFPDGVVPAAQNNKSQNGPGMTVELRCFNKDGTRSFASRLTGGGYDEKIETRFFSSNGAPTYIYRKAYADMQDTAYAFEINKWNHVTFIIEVANQDPTTGAFDMVYYTAFNGEIVSKTEVGDIARPTDASQFYNGDSGAVYPTEVHFIWGDGKDGNSFEYDNVAVRTFDKTYEGNLSGILEQGNGADLTKWDANVYDYRLMPYGNTIVENDGVEYDSLQRAIDAAEDGDVLTLLANIPDRVIVDKEITIDGSAGDYECNPGGASGYQINREGYVWTVEASSDFCTVNIGACECGNNCFDAITLELNKGANIWDSYVDEVGKIPSCKTIFDDEKLTANVFLGFVDDSGVLEGLELTFDENLIVTEDLIGETLELVPVYENENAWAKVGDSYFYPHQNIAAAFLAAPAGSTVQLIGNVETTKAMTITNNVTLDLNGYRFATLTDATAGDAAYNTFTTTADEFTITSSRVGGTYYDNHITAVTWGNGYNAGGNGSILSGKDGAKINFVGTNEAGETTLSFYAACLVNNYGRTANISIDGGNYIGSGMGNRGYFSLRSTGQLSVKNAFFYGTHNRIFALGGQNNLDKSGVTVTFDNCVIEGKHFGDAGFEGLVVNFTNCYIGVNLECNDVWAPDSPGVGIGANKELASCYVLGEGNYLEDGIACTAAFAEGVAAYDTNLVKEISYKTNMANNVTEDEPWIGGEKAYALTPHTAKVTYTKFTAPAGLTDITVTWLDTDGETVLGTTTAFPGTEATPPSTVVPGTNGMVEQIYSDWVGGTKVPFDATEHSIVLAENSAVTYVAGTVQILFNFDMINHFQYNHYVPEAPEGITYVSINANGGGEVEYGNWRFPAPDQTDFEGNKWSCVSSWPGVANVDNDFSFTVTYTWNGHTLTYEAPKVNLAKYVNYVLTSDKYDTVDQSAFKTAMADMLRMIEQANVAVGQTTGEEFKAVYELAEPLMSAVDNVVDETAVNDLSAIEEYIDDVSVVYVSRLTGMSIEVDPKEGYVAYITSTNLHGMNVVGKTQINVNTDDKDRCYAHNIRSWGMAEVMTISIYSKADCTFNGQDFASLPETALATAEFTVAGYVNANGASFTDAETALFNAILAYAHSGMAYMDWRSAYLGKE